jgi:hypothetical protein
MRATHLADLILLDLIIIFDEEYKLLSPLCYFLKYSLTFSFMGQILSFCQAHYLSFSGCDRASRAC